MTFKVRIIFFEGQAQPIYFTPLTFSVLVDKIKLISNTIWALLHKYGSLTFKWRSRSYKNISFKKLLVHRTRWGNKNKGFKKLFLDHIHPCIWHWPWPQNEKTYGTKKVISYSNSLKVIEQDKEVKKASYWKKSFFDPYLFLNLTLTLSFKWKKKNLKFMRKVFICVHAKEKI